MCPTRELWSASQRRVHAKLVYVTGQLFKQLIILHAANN